MKVRLLIVDDEIDICEMLSRHFRYLGYDVETASNGIEALEKLATKNTQIVISDIKMPQMDGIKLLRAVRQQYPMIHIIMITGYVTQENALFCMRQGADTCIFKPLEELAELEEAVSSAIVQIKHWQGKLKALREMSPLSSGGCHE